MTIIYADIETIGTEDPAVIADLAADISHPKTMSKPETIAKWEAEDKPALVDEAVRKTAFDGGLGRIVCIGWAVGDCEPVAAFEGPESEVLRNFFSAVQVAVNVHYRGGSTASVPVFCGHNINAFDLRFLWQRAVVNGIKPPSGIPFHAKAWDKNIADTMVMWNPEYGKRISLDNLCKALGVKTPKGDLDGSKVWDYVKAGRIAEVAEYCKGDVVAVRECHNRMIFR